QNRPAFIFTASTPPPRTSVSGTPTAGRKLEAVQQGNWPYRSAEGVRRRWHALDRLEIAGGRRKGRECGQETRDLLQLGEAGPAKALAEVVHEGGAMALGQEASVGSQVRNRDLIPTAATDFVLVPLIWSDGHEPAVARERVVGTGIAKVFL